jgi:hypothetical protein
MIVFNFEILDQFLAALSNRIHNQIFFHIRAPNSGSDQNESVYEVMLQFLGRPDPQVLVLHQCAIKLQKKEEREVVIARLKETFKTAGDIILIQGRIQELIMSLT